MNIGKMFVLLLGFIEAQKFLEVAPITKLVGERVVAHTNRVRHKVHATDMCELSWDQPLANMLVDYSRTLPSDWFFNYTNLPNPNGYGNHTFNPNKTSALNSSFNGFHLMRLPPFNISFPGYDFVIHDTFVSPKRLGFIFGFRLNQLHCINWDKCDSVTYQSFKSCADPLVQEPSKKCSWATQYVPRLMFSKLKSMACVTFKEHGPSAPLPQEWSFFCYGKAIHPVNDIAFSRDLPALGCQG